MNDESKKNAKLALQWFDSSHQKPDFDYISSATGSFRIDREKRAREYYRTLHTFLIGLVVVDGYMTPEEANQHSSVYLRELIES